MSWIAALLLIVALVLALPALVLFIETVASCLPERRARTATGDYGRTAFLVPAHNEGRGLLPTLEDLARARRPQDLVLVVADNCDDDTAAVARAHGAEAAERHDPLRRGKGYALAFGLAHLASDPPDLVIIVDADCRADNLSALAGLASATGRPAQACYLMTGESRGLAAFAWLLRNKVRPLGLARLGAACQLTGSGMAVPWPLLKHVDLASAELAEDLKMGLDLAAAGHPPVFCPEALVTSAFPTGDDAARRQRQRWEQGALRAAAATVPRLLAAGLSRFDIRLIALACDALVPPLVLYAAALMVGLVIATGAALLGASPLPAIVLAAATVLAGSSLVIAERVHAPGALAKLRPRELAAHLAAKRFIYRGLLSSRAPAWTRTNRDPS